MLLNIASIRCVTRNPPTTLIVAKVTATNPTSEVKFIPAATITAPTRVMPLIAFEQGQEFLVIDRASGQPNCDEHMLDEAVMLVEG